MFLTGTLTAVPATERSRVPWNVPLLVVGANVTPMGTDEPTATAAEVTCPAESVKAGELPVAI